MAIMTMMRGKIASVDEARLHEVVVVALADGHASTAVGPLELFNAAGVAWQHMTGGEVRPRFRVRCASMDGRPVRMSGGIVLKPDVALGDVGEVDLAYVSSGGLDVDRMLDRHPAAIEFVRRVHQAGSHVAAVCSGVGILAASGLLDGVEATSHWGLIEPLRRRFPQTSWRSGRMVTEAGRVYCGGGVYAALDLAIWLVEAFSGRATAIECAKALLVEMPRGSQPGYLETAVAPAHQDRRILKAEQIIQRSYARTINLESVAEKVSMSQRNFIRRFKQVTGVSPMAYVHRIRIDRAKHLIERGGRNTQQIAERIGYSDVAHFRRIFKRMTGQSPSDYRRTFWQV